mgnify:FL=1
MDDLLINLVNASQPSIIKVIGVGGGGGNAVAHMYRNGNFADVNFLVCNADAKALEISPVPDQLQLGNDGLGAGGKPEIGRQLAEESIDSIRRVLDPHTKMLFITAGMGGGTGTGAAPVIAREARKRGILTVGIVTIPFRFEGIRKIDKALDGVDAMAAQADALIVINNELLRENYQNYSVTEGFQRADDTLSIAVKSIVDIITMHGKMILDFRDVYNTLHDGGIAVMSTGYASGEGRVARAIADALNSPFVCRRDIYKSRKILMSISTSTAHNLMIYEMNDINAFMLNFEDKYIETKYGLATDESLGDRVKVTLLASGFALPNKEKQETVIHFSEEDIRRVFRRKQHYGNEAATRPTRHLCLFNTDELDNDALLQYVEETPTQLRRQPVPEHLRTHS